MKTMKSIALIVGILALMACSICTVGQMWFLFPLVAIGNGYLVYQGCEAVAAIWGLQVDSDLETDLDL